MNSGVGCLREQVEKWFGRESAHAVAVLNFGRTSHDGGRFVRMGGQWPGNQLAIVFFRHHDGTWHVFPPAPRAATMLAR